MIVEMLKMPSVSWMVKMDGGWKFHGEAEEETIRGIVLEGLT